MEQLLLFLLVIPLAVWAAIHAKKTAAAIDAVWGDAAERLGGSFYPGVRKFFGSAPRRIVATVEGIDVEVDHYTVRTSKYSSTTYTRLRANARASAAFSLRVSHTHVLSGLANALGFQDVRIGNASFDEAYVIKSNDVEAAPLWLNSTVRNRIRKAHGYSFELDDGVVKAQTARLERDPQDIVTAVRAVVAVANGRQHLLRVWREVARRHGGKVKSRQRRWATLDLELDGVPVTIDTTIVGGAHFTFASAQVVGASLEPFVLAVDERFMLEGHGEDGIEELTDYTLWCTDRDAVLAHLDERARRAIADFGPSEVRAEDGEVFVTWPGICVDTPELEAATGLVAMLASGPGRGPYR